jgi:hypothetical protein
MLAPNAGTAERGASGFGILCADVSDEGSRGLIPSPRFKLLLGNGVKRREFKAKFIIREHWQTKSVLVYLRDKTKTFLENTFLIHD